MDTGYTDDFFACVSLHRYELLAINNALNEVLFGPRPIAASEFHTRTGVFPEEAMVLLEQVGELLERMHPLGRSSETSSTYFNKLR